MGKPAPRRAAIPVLCVSASKLQVITAAEEGWESHLMKAQFLEQFNSKKRQSLSGCGGPTQPGSQTPSPPPSLGPIRTPRVPESNWQLPGSLSCSGTLLSSIGCGLRSQTAWVYHLALPSLTGNAALNLLCVSPE